MAISVDNVYQKVLALANKEQRGYITPQEFNLLADKAQNDIFEMYFHEYKTALLSPGNQSKTADDIDMLREKISAHRIVGGAVSSVGVLPTDAHWLESIYDGNAYRKIELTCTAGSNISDNTGFVVLKAIYSGDGGVAAGEGLYNIMFNTTAGSATDASDLGPGYLYVNHDMSSATAANVATEIMEAINDGSPYHSASIKGGTVDVVVVTYKQPDIVGSGENTLNAGITIGGVSSVSDFVVYEEVDKDNWTYIKSNKRLNPSKTSRGIFYRKNATTIGALPALSAAIQCDYIKKPAKPSWGYVVIGDKALYNSNTSTDFELHASEESTLTNKILELAGIVVNKPGLSEVILRNEAVKEANENK